MKQKMLYKQDLSLLPVFGSTSGVPAKTKSKNKIYHSDFDCHKILSNAMAFQLQQLELFMTDGLLVGFKMTYLIDSIKVTKLH